MKIPIMLRVLIPTDLSRGAANALRYAMQLTQGMDVELILFQGNVIPVPMAEMPIVTDMPNKDDTVKSMNEEVQKVAASLQQKDNKNISCMVSAGLSLAPMIEDAAAQAKADLIVMGTHGATGIIKVLIGSNTVSVIETSKHPVLIVPEHYEFVQPHLVLMPSDLKFFEQELLDAAPFAQLIGATLEVLFFSDATEDAMKRYDDAAKVIEKNSYKKITLSLESTRFGKTIADDIERSVKKKNPDMLIMFRHEHNWLGNLFLTSQTDHVAFATKIPLLAFHEPKRIYTN